MERTAESTNPLLEPISPSQAADYHKEVLSRLHCQNLAVCAIPDKGHGLVAQKDFTAGEVVFTEQPLFSQQHEVSKDTALCCSHCLKFLGSLELQAAWVLRHGDVPAELLQRLQTGQLKLPSEVQVSLPSLIVCRGMCDELYCSPECADKDWEHHHSLLCPGENGPHASNNRKREALVSFHDHARRTNDAFILASKVIAHTLKEAQNLAQKGTNRTEALLEAWRPLGNAWKGIWWSTIALPEDVNPKVEQAVTAFRSDLKTLAAESLELLKKALWDDKFEALFDLDVYGSIIGAFELNNMGIQIPSILDAAFGESCAILPTDDKDAGLVIKELEDVISREEIACGGTGFFALQSLANHSCCPNVEQQETDALSLPDNCITFVAVRDIQAGEEICMSYITEDLDYDARTEALQDYGFVCQCKLCLDKK